jgi:hypothetical protein
MTGSRKRPSGAELGGPALRKRIAEFQNYHPTPLPAGVAASQEATYLQTQAPKNEKLLEEVNYYEQQAVTTQILESCNRNVYPLGQIVHGTPIEFRHQAGTEQYVDLSRSTLCVRCKITKADGTAIAADAKIAPINNVLHSLFNNIEVFVNNTKVTQPHNYYAYIAYLAQLTSFEPAVLEKLKRCEGYYQDTKGQVNVASDANEGWEKRRKLFANSNEVRLEGRPFVPIFIQEKLIPGNVPINIRLHPSTDTFVLHRGAGGDNEAYKLQIVQAMFRINEKRVSSTLLTEHMKARVKEPFRYKYTDIVPKTHVVPQGASQINANNIYEGTLPDRLTVLMLNSNEMNGSYETSPFYHRHFDAQYVQVESNGALIPSQAIETNFRSTPQDITFAYLQQMRELDIAIHNTAPAVDPDEWANGFTFYTFGIIPSPEDEDAKAPSKQGALTVKGVLRKATTSTMTLLLIAEYQGRWMEIDLYNQVST